VRWGCLIKYWMTGRVAFPLTEAEMVESESLVGDDNSEYAV